jgi:hypothetical protein
MLGAIGYTQALLQQERIMSAKQDWPVFMRHLKVGGVAVANRRATRKSPWLWAGAATEVVWFQGRAQRLSTALFILFNGALPEGFRVRRKVDTDMEDFRPENFELVPIVNKFIDPHNSWSQELQELIDYLRSTNAQTFEHIDLEMLQDEPKLRVAAACDELGIKVPSEYVMGAE